MNDTPAAVRILFHRKMMERSGNARFLMGMEMFEAARAMVLASFPRDLPPAEVRRRLFTRFYGQDFPPDVRTGIMQRLSEETALPKVHPSETENR